ncbi:hypothetical protein [Roseovarius sp. MMSF_3281]|uniref:hypothetical protein n=1 Tax=Roseovarius sp. MMSF_3281 TaxID=3046694 RepID=UPI00273EBEFC|nr:hypothetical protein [Roseovarius sp. MMSF_3281]
MSGAERLKAEGIAKVRAYEARRDKLAAEEAARVWEVFNKGHVPPECGPEIPHAPARGTIQVFQDVTLYPDGEDGWKAEYSGYRGRSALRVGDAFDVMHAKARKVLFSPGQVAMGRFYAALFEAHASAGVQCSSLEGRVDRGGGGGGEFIDAVLRDRERLDMLRARIGGGVAMQVRKQRPSAVGSRRLISDRDLVDAVCIHERTLADVLKAHGWTKTGKSVAALRGALRDALDRMMGPQPVSRVQAVEF